MNRRDLFKALAAVPVGALALKPELLIAAPAPWLTLDDITSDALKALITPQFVALYNLSDVEACIREFAAFHGEIRTKE